MDASEQTNSGDSAPHYEFTADQNRTIGELAAAMQWVAVPLIVIGILYAVSAVGHLIWAFGNWRALLPAILVALGAVLYLVLGTWTKQAANSFGDVVSTTGSDINHLMSALDNLRKKYALLSLFVKIYVALLAIGIVAAMVMWVAGYFGAPAA